METAGRLAGIARHDRPGGPIETADAGEVTAKAGLVGDHRGALRGSPWKRQLSLIEADGFAAARDEVGASNLRWYDTRRNLLVEGVRLPRRAGARLRIGPDCVIEITDECTPCQRMDGLHDGLQAALRPDWRGGFLAKVIADGAIALGDEIRIET